MDSLDIPKSDPVLISRSFPAGGTRELDYPARSSNTSSDSADDDWPLLDENDKEDHWLLNGEHDSQYYGSSVPVSSELPRRQKHLKKRKRESVGPSLTKLATKFFSTDQLHNSSDDDDDGPPTIEMKYTRSKLDWAKLVILPIVYILLMGVAVVFAFYTIQGLLESYSNKVRSVQQINVNGRYSPIGIAVFPRFSDYQHCEYRYYDNLAPISQYPAANLKSCGQFQVPTTCIWQNLTFNSSIVQNLTRSVMVFQGPTLVKCKQSLKLSFGMDTTQREFSAIEYILFDDWESFHAKSEQEQRDFLAFIELNRTVYTFPAGFRTWVKLSYSVYNRGKKNFTDFNIIDSYGAYNEYNDTYMPMEILFEWKTGEYDYIQEIISTTVWSAFGSFCGLLLTIVKIGEFCKAWIRRFRRDKQKKRLHLQKLEEEQKKLLETYEIRKKERREKAKLQSMEATTTHAINVCRP